MDEEDAVLSVWTCPDHLHIDVVDEDGEVAFSFELDLDVAERQLKRLLKEVRAAIDQDDGMGPVMGHA